MADALALHRYPADPARRRASPAVGEIGVPQWFPRLLSSSGYVMRAIASATLGSLLPPTSMPTIHVLACAGAAPEGPVPTAWSCATRGGRCLGPRQVPGGPMRDQAELTMRSTATRASAPRSCFPPPSRRAMNHTAIVRQRAELTDPVGATVDQSAAAANRPSAAALALRGVRWRRRSARTTAVIPSIRISWWRSPSVIAAIIGPQLTTHPRPIIAP